jgi:multicomponent Na+:H+ antiporter subunit E
MIAALAWRLVIAAVAWWALAEGAAPRGPGLAVAVVAVTGAAVGSLALRRPGARAARPARIPRFAAFFLAQSVVGGLDVARRALLPRGVVRPGFVEFSPALPAGTPRALFLEMVSVMPGTLVAEETSPGGALRIHVIDTDLPVHRSLERVESELRRLFGLE